MDDQSYLEPGFDPSTLTVPRLRSILLAHSVNYPSSAKKQQLIDVFNEHVAPQARKILSASARVKRTSRGIEDVASGRRGTGAGDDIDDEIPLPPVTPASRTGRRTTRARTEEAEEVVAPASRSTRHSTAPPEATPRRSSSKHARTMEQVKEEPAPKRSASRKSRASAATPAFKAESADDDSPFSNENVFQSGSSPPEPRASEPDRRRTTQSAAKDQERRNREIRRRTDEVKPARSQVNNAVVPSRRTFEFPIHSFKKEEVEASEEFTPEGEMEIAQAQQAGELVPVRRTNRRSRSGPPQAIGVIFVAILAGLSYIWGQEKFNVGYCGVGRPSSSIRGVEIPDWADVLRPQCEPCPPHAYCHDRLQIECEKGFVLQPHPLTLGGILPLPLPPSCEPDSAKARKVNAVKERAVEQLRAANAKFECGEASKPELKETELKSSVSKMRRTSMSGEEFEDLWADAIGEIVNADEIVSGSDGTGHAVLRSTSLAALPLACAVRRSLRQTLRQYFWQLVAVFLVLSSGAYGRHRITSSYETEAEAKRLAGLSLEKLSLQASLNAQEPEIFTEKFVSVAQLRDDVLRREFSATRRKKVWEKVQKKVEGNANVRSMVREHGTGDVGRVWEWVGAVGMLESPQQGPGMGGRRKSGRVSFAAEDSLIGMDGEKVGAVVRRADGTDVRKWEEGKAYY